MPAPFHKDRKPSVIITGHVRHIEASNACHIERDMNL